MNKDPIVPFVKLRSKNIFCSAELPSSRIIPNLIDWEPAALKNTEYVNVWSSTTVPAAPVSNVSVPLSNLTASESKVSKAVKLKSLCKIWLPATPFCPTYFSAVNVPSGPAKALSVLVRLVSVQLVPNASGLVQRLVPETWPAMLLVIDLALLRYSTFEASVYQV